MTNIPLPVKCLIVCGSALVIWIGGVIIMAAVSPYDMPPIFGPFTAICWVTIIIAGIAGGVMFVSEEYDNDND